MDLARQLRIAAIIGNETAVRQLLAAGARPDQADSDGGLPLHFASSIGHEGVVRLLLKATPATAFRVTRGGWTPLHCAAAAGRVAVMRLLLEAATAAAHMLDTHKWAPIHAAAYHSSSTAAVQVLLEAAPEVAYAPTAHGRTPLHMLLDNPTQQRSADQVKETARCLVRAAPAVQPTLGALVDWCDDYPFRTALFADLVARLPLSQEQWQSIPAPCPDLARALPAVLQRSAAEAGWLVGRLAEEQQARLQAAALSLAREQHQRSVGLPAELSGRILALCLLP